MRILVAGATGYIGTRLVPELLRRGHHVVAASSSSPRPERFTWGDQVASVRMDATDAAQVSAAVDGVDAVCYLVHGLSTFDFRARDRLAAENVRDAVEARRGSRGLPVRAGARRPRAPALPAHRVAARGGAGPAARALPRTLSMRAGIVIGAGSTSFELVRQTASTFLVQPVPLWMHSRVQPIAVADAATGARGRAGERRVGDVDIAGPDVISYPDLLELYADVAGLSRLQVPVAAPVLGGVADRRAGVRGAVLDGGGADPQPAPRHGLPAGQPDPALVDLTDALPLREAMEQAVVADGTSGRSPDGCAATRRGCRRRGWSGRSAPPGCPARRCSARRCTSPSTGSAARSRCCATSGRQLEQQAGAGRGGQQPPLRVGQRRLGERGAATRCTTRPSQVTCLVPVVMPRRNFTLRSRLV